VCQALEELSSSSFLDTRLTVDDEVFAKTSFVDSISFDGEANTRITLEVLNFLIRHQMAYDYLVPFHVDPNTGCLG
jgi:hypothetical protein